MAKALVDAGDRLDDVERAVAAAKALDPGGFDEKLLKSHAVGEVASIVSALPEVRAVLLAFQRDFGRAPPGAVLDGRDIGTVICPAADVKIKFLRRIPRDPMTNSYDWGKRAMQDDPKSGGGGAQDEHVEGKAAGETIEMTRSRHLRGEDRLDPFPRQVGQQGVVVDAGGVDDAP